MIRLSKAADGTTALIRYISYREALVITVVMSRENRNVAGIHSATSARHVVNFLALLFDQREEF